MKTIFFQDLVSKRIDVYLAQQFPEKYRTQWQYFIELGLIKVEDKIIKSKYKLSEGQKITIDIEKIEQIENLSKQIKPLNINLDIIFENENLAIINKPIGLATHSGPGNIENTLTGALINKYGKESLSDCGEVDRPGIVHRLDKNTTGLIIVAKNNFSHVSLANQIKLKTCKRKYLALCHGVFMPTNGIITTTIARDSDDYRKRKVVDSNQGKIAITHYKTINIFAEGSLSLVEFELETGRTHQIRVHALYKKHPVIGDNVYCNNKYKTLNNLDYLVKKAILEFSRQALHSFYIKFIEPTTLKEIEVLIPLPLDMQDIIKMVS